MTKAINNPKNDLRKIIGFRVLFSLFPLIIVLVIATLVLLVLEMNGIIDTSSKYSRASNLEADYLRIIQFRNVSYFQINPPTSQSSLPVEKQEGTFRIVITGGSFARGDPYVHENHRNNLTGIPKGNPAGQVGGIPGYGGLTSWLHVILSECFPSVTFEVLNAGFAGASSLKVKRIVKRLMQVKPDLVIVASGNNEGFGTQTAIHKLFSHSVLYRALKKLIIRAPKQLDRYFCPDISVSGMKRVDRDFRRNANEIIEITRKNDVSLALATLPVNLLYNGPSPYFANKPAPTFQDDEWIKQSVFLQGESRYEEAIEAFDKSQSRAQAALLAAQVCYKLGQFEKAKKYYKSFAQLCAQGRTRPSLNDQTRLLGQAYGVAIIDLENKMETISPHGLSGSEYFWDHCHLTWQGYYLMAEEIARVLIDEKIVSGVEGEPRSMPQMDEIINKYNWQSLHHYKPEQWWQ